jgi:flagellar protein FlaI
VNKSAVLQDIADDRGWGARELAESLNDREEFLQYLVDEGIDGYKEVTAAIHAFGNDREELMRKVEAGTLTPDELNVDEEAEELYR